MRRIFGICLALKLCGMAHLSWLSIMGLFVCLVIQLVIGAILNAATEAR